MSRRTTGTGRGTLSCPPSVSAPWQRPHLLLVSAEKRGAGLAGGLLAVGRSGCAGARFWGSALGAPPLGLSGCPFSPERNPRLLGGEGEEPAPRILVHSGRVGRGAGDFTIFFCRSWGEGCLNHRNVLSPSLEIGSSKPECQQRCLCSQALLLGS